jgi:RNA polymerase-binding protein DksA
MPQQTLDLKRIRERLLQERARMTAELERIQDRSSESQLDETGELSAYDNDVGDLGTNTFEREKDMTMEQTLQDMIEQVDAALLKIDRGTYGICDQCNNPIAPARLEAIPYASLCISCQASSEGA